MSPPTWRLLTFASAVAAALALALAPGVSTSSCTTSAGGATVCTSDSSTLIASEGRTIVLLLAVPALIALVPVLRGSRGSTLVAAVVLSASALLGLASVGVFFIPTVVLAWISFVRADDVSVSGAPRVRF